MKNKWLILCMVFILGLIGSPAFTYAPAGDDVFFGSPVQAVDTVSTAHPEAVQLGTVMGTLLGVIALVFVYVFTVKLTEGPATNVPMRYDKARDFTEKLA